VSGRLLSFSNYIGGADNVQVLEKFPSEQKTFTYDFPNNITGYNFELDAQTIVVDTLTYDTATGNPNFTLSTVLGSFANIEVLNSNVSVTDAANGFVDITMPANLYPGNVLMPDARTNVPITVFSVQWTDTNVTPNTIESHRWAVLERYKPGDRAIGNVLADASFVTI